MDSLIVTLPLHIEVFFYPSFRGRSYIGGFYCQGHPTWTADDLAFVAQTITEGDRMRESIVKTIEIEVLVEFFEKDGKRIPISATCQTECPGVVRGWAEPKAMSMIRGHEILMDHLVKETQALGGYGK
jgi:hypothetical protein